MVAKRCSSWSENFIHFASRQQFSYQFCHPERASAVFCAGESKDLYFAKYFFVLRAKESAGETVPSLRDSPSFPTLLSAYALGYSYSPYGADFCAIRSNLPNPAGSSRTLLKPTTSASSKIKTRSTHQAHLPVTISQHNVDAADGGHNVGDQAAFAHLPERLQIRKRRRTHMHSIRLGRAIAHNVIAHLAARRLDGHVHFARRHGESFGDDLKVVDERFHLRLHLLAVGQHDMWSVSLHRTFGNSFQRLRGNLLRFAELGHAHQISRVNVSVLRDWDVELEVLISAVRLVAPQVDIHATASLRRTGCAKCDCIFGGEVRHALGAIHPNWIAGQQALVFINVRREAIEKTLHAVEETQWRLKRKSTNAEVRGHHALARNRFEQAQHVFTLAEAIEEDRHGADVQRVRSQPYQVGVDAGQLVQHDADPLRARRDIKPQQLLHRQAVSQVVGHGAEIINAIGERHHLLVELGLAGLLDARVQIPDIGHHPHDGFAVNLQQQPEHAMGRRVLRTHVQDHRLIIRRIQHRRWGHVGHDQR